jgi:hypothetical protein
MKLLIKILFVCFLLLVTLSSVLHLVVNIEGRPLLTRKLKQIFHKEVSIGRVETSFPFNIIIKDLEVKDLFKIEEVFANGGVIDILRRGFILTELRLSGAVLDLEKLLAPEVAPQNLPAPTQAAAVSSVSEEGNLFLPPLTLKRFVINRGVVHFVDRNVSDKGIAITLKDVNFIAENLIFPIRGSVITSFSLKGRVPWQEGQEEGKVKIEGWANLFKKDAQAKVEIEGIDGLYLYPYYSQWMNLEKARVERAKLNFSSDIQALNNNLIADCHLELTDIVFKPRESLQEEGKAEKIASVVLDIFRSLNQGKIAVDFKIKTKLDRPDFSFGHKIRAAVQDTISQSKRGDKLKVEEFVMFPERLIEGTVKGAAGVSQAMISGAFTLGNEFAKAIFAAFRKEPKTEEGNP